MFGTTWTLAIALTLGVAHGTDKPTPQAPVRQLPAVTWTDDRPLTHFFPNLWRDLRALPSANSAAVLAIGGASAAVIHDADEDFADWALSSGERYTQIGDVLGNGWTQAGGAVATYAIGKLAHSPQVTHVGSDLVRAQVLNAVITTTLKVAVDRQRPNGGHWSFPSGHTSATFASAATLHAHYGWKVGIPAFATAGFVAWTRVRDREHWLSDVAFGSAVGIVAGSAVASKHGPRRVRVVPAVTKGGAMVMVFVQGRGQRAEGRGK